MNKATIIGILIGSILLFGAGQRFYLSQYEEECYEYKIYYWNETYCKSWWDYYGDWKNDNQERPCCNKETYDFIWGHNGTEDESYWCNGFPFNKTFWKFTDECSKYHLVRIPSQSEEDNYKGKKGNYIGTSL